MPSPHPIQWRPYAHAHCYTLCHSVLFVHGSRRSNRFWKYKNVLFFFLVVTRVRQHRGHNARISRVFFFRWAIVPPIYRKVNLGVSWHSLRHQSYYVYRKGEKMTSKTPFSPSKKRAMGWLRLGMKRRRFFHSHRRKKWWAGFPKIPKKKRLHDTMVSNGVEWQLYNMRIRHNP